MVELFHAQFVNICSSNVNVCPSRNAKVHSSSVRSRKRTVEADKNQRKSVANTSETNIHGRARRKQSKFMARTFIRKHITHFGSMHREAMCLYTAAPTKSHRHQISSLCWCCDGYGGPFIISGRRECTNIIFLLLFVKKCIMLWLLAAVWARVKR